MYHLEVDQSARDQQIFDLTHIRPIRKNLSSSATANLIRGVQVGDEAAMQSLIAHRLGWMGDTMASNEAVQDRDDLELADVLQIGCLATIEAAQSVNFEAKTPPDDQLYQGVSQQMSRLMLEAQLIRPLEQRSGSKKRQRIQSMQDMPVIADRAISVGLAVADRLSGQPNSTENILFSDPAETVNLLLSTLSERKRAIIRGWLDMQTPRVIDGEIQGPTTLTALGEQFGITYERVRQILHDFGNTIYFYNEHNDDELHATMGSDFTNYGLRD
jgi:hypothetical protein